jgi:hypothetical protein
LLNFELNVMLVHEKLECKDDKKGKRSNTNSEEVKFTLLKRFSPDFPIAGVRLKYNLILTFKYHR